jgi:predicted ester cyclase
MNRWCKEIWNEGQTIYELMDENAIGIGQDPNGAIHGPAGFESLFSGMRGAFPDLKITLEDIFGSGDKVAVRRSAAMTHTDNHLGLPASNKPVRTAGISIARIENGKIREGRDNWDQFAMMQQIANAAATTP